MAIKVIAQRRLLKIGKNPGNNPGNGVRRHVVTVRKGRKAQLLSLNSKPQITQIKRITTKLLKKNLPYRNDMKIFLYFCK